MADEQVDPDWPPIELKSIRPGTDTAELLSQRGWYLMREVFQALDPGSDDKYKLAFKQIQRLIDQGQDPFLIMGRRKLGARVCVLMERFAPWHRANLLLQAERLTHGPHRFSDFMAIQNGFYHLAEVCRRFADYLPYSYVYLKRESDKRVDPRREMGVFKYDTTYLTEMPRFAQWLQKQILD